MWIKKKEIEQLSEFVKGYSSGEELDIRVNKEGSFNILKNDIYALVNMKNEQIKAVETERDSLSDYMADISHQLKTPITSMMIMADLLEEAEPEKQTEFIHNIQVSLNKMEWSALGANLLQPFPRFSFQASVYRRHWKRIAPPQEERATGSRCQLPPQRYRSIP